MHIEALLKHIQHPVKHSHIHNLAILRALAYLELQPYSKPSETLTRHIQKSVSAERFIEALLSHIQI